MRIVEFGLLAVRLILASIFLLAGATKLVNPVAFRRTLRDFELPLGLARPLVLVLPLLELGVAAALIPTSLAWYGAWGAIGLLGIFLVAVGITMVRGRKPDCQCFGQLHSEPVGRGTLLRNVVLAATAGWLASRGPGRSGPDIWAWFNSLSDNALKIVLVAGCVVAFVFLRAVLGSRSPRHVVAAAVPVIEEAREEEGSAEEEVRAVRPAPAPKPVMKPRPLPAEPPAPVNTGPMGIGLPIGTAAPEFELPGINGEKRSLRSLCEKGRDVLLVFSSPYCTSCEALASILVRWMREIEGIPSVILISRGTVKDNLAKLKGFETSRVLLQREAEVSEAYDCNATPAAVLVDAGGLIRSELAVGADAIKQLCLVSAKRGKRKERIRQAPV